MTNPQTPTQPKDGIKLLTTTGVVFDVIEADDLRLRITIPQSDKVFTVYHHCAIGSAVDECILADGTIVHEYGKVMSREISNAWDWMLAGVTCFLVDIVEFVGDLEFHDKHICCAPSLEALEDQIEKAMPMWRGKGEYDSCYEMWDFGESSAQVFSIREVDRHATKLALQQRIILLWLWA
ncbi:hypothetical protein [Serratia ficaria]|uniref:hypothetical protein n=1 Tax=Serratia ficaria TaxID=61651 RepID=UPI00077C5475|nr:hypothetical protein [Serratia ficaria]